MQNPEKVTAEMGRTAEGPVLVVVTQLDPGGGAGRTRVFVWALATLSIWALVFLGLRFFLAGAAPYSGPLEFWKANTQPGILVRAIVQVGLFGGVLWLFAPAGLRRSPRFVRRSALAAPLYLAGVLLFGVWYEVRLLLPLYPIFLPPALYQLSWLLDHEAQGKAAATST